MNKTRQFILLSLLLIASRFYDVYTTYLYIPDLHGETNVLVKYLGAGWSTVIILQTVLVLFLASCLYHYLFRFKRQQARAGMDFKAYISYIHFHNEYSFNKLLFQLPANRKIILPALGFIASMTLIAAGFIVGTSTLFLLLSERYKAVYRQGGPYVLYALILASGVYFSILFYRKEYRLYRKGL